ncbi:glyoxalase-like protein [Stella humosa]|uniref:Glyoxalase-like protein n=1 Tax=Stella humosa TaxID=94 RepID=A0A3N1MK32_9PROT|nr:VOC family protein [Stella humosa]ROQ01346.1 glyoxalase-like protein [Stella humosa]BBK31720.1 hypothetical protein STHU_23540 [Stella humosa]
MTPAEAATIAAQQVPTGDRFVIDHLAHWVPEERKASARLAELGFTMAPFSHQVTRAAPDAPPVSAGTANRTIMLREGYIEILTVTGDTPNARTLQAGMARYVGVHLIAFGLADPDATAARLQGAGFAPLPVVRLEREIETEAGTPGHVRFRVLRVGADAMPEGRVQFCHHLTPENMWQGRWLDHANGAIGLRSILIASDDPEEAAERYARFTGQPVRQRDDGAWVLAFDRGALVIADQERCQRLLSAPIPAIPCMAAYALAVADPAATRQHLTAGRIAFTDTGGAMLVDGGPALGAQIAFLADGAKAPWD